MATAEMRVTPSEQGATMTIEHLIVGATGVGYLIVGVLQWTKDEECD
jgi:hypothetical protein